MWLQTAINACIFAKYIVLDKWNQNCEKIILLLTVTQTGNQTHAHCACSCDNPADCRKLQKAVASAAARNRPITFFKILQFVQQFLHQSDFFRPAPSRILLSIAFCGAFQQIIQGILPIFLHFFNIFTVLPLLEKANHFLFILILSNFLFFQFFGALLQSSFNCLLLLNFMLPIHRLCATIRIQILHDFGDSEAKWEKRLGSVISILLLWKCLISQNWYEYHLIF